MSKVAIITPAYHGEVYLRHFAVPSVQGQTFTDWTYYIIHDGPEKDNTAEYIKSLNEPRIVYKTVPRAIPEPGNGRFFGPDERQWYTVCGFNCTNHARDLIDEAGHQYIFHLNQDDFWMKDHLALMVKALDRSMDHYMAWPISMIFDHNYFTVYMGKPFDRDKIFGGPWGGPAWSSICYRREGPYEKYFTGQPGVCSDWEWLKKFIISTKKPSIFVPVATTIIFRNCAIDFAKQITKAIAWSADIR